MKRRRFVQTMGAGAAGVWISARGLEGGLFRESTAFAAEQAGAASSPIILSSNENPVGPGKAVTDAIRAAFGPGGATAGRYSQAPAQLTEAIAKKFGVKPENVALGAGSTQILRSCTHLFTAPTKALVATIPAYEECSGYADMMGHPVRAVPLNASLKMDLDRLVDASRGAGMVFYCNPNNPVSTYVGARATSDFMSRVNRVSPETMVLIDEAYYDYVTDPDHATHVPMAVADPRFIVARTFSKAYGMAGMRMGYAIGHADTIKKLNDFDAATGSTSLNVLALHAGIAAISQDASFIQNERARNTAARDFTMKWFTDRGMTPAESQTNFMFVNLGRPAKEFRDACAAKGVRVGRDFPPYEKTHCRISFGTMEEMQKAVAVFGEVLAKKADAAA